MKPLPIILAFGFSLMLPLPAVASDAAPVQLPESLAQGDLVVGRTQPGSEVVYGDRSLRVDAQGHFVFGPTAAWKPCSAPSPAANGRSNAWTACPSRR